MLCESRCEVKPGYTATDGVNSGKEWNATYMRSTLIPTRTVDGEIIDVDVA